MTKISALSVSNFRTYHVIKLTIQLSTVLYVSLYNSLYQLMLKKDESVIDPRPDSVFKLEFIYVKSDTMIMVEITANNATFHLDGRKYQHNVPIIKFCHSSLPVTV